MGFLEKVFGDLNTKEVKKLEKIADQILALEGQMEKLSDAELKAKTPEFKERLKNGETLDDILVEAFAVCREAAWRSLGMKHFRVQLIGGIVLHQGRIAEMRTGEGKTLVATLPTYLNALEGKGVHVVTVNDYLARRDMEWMGKLYTWLGLTVDCIVHGITKEQRRAAYNADITYGTNNEFGFDYLRDNMVIYKEDLMQRPLNFAVVDEVDSILIDEARTPLIISGQGDQANELYGVADRMVRLLKVDVDYTIDEKERSVALTDEGVAKCERAFHIENFSDPQNMEINHHVLAALRANAIMRRDVDYIVKDGEIVIVDEFTGRLMFGRRYSNGLHQAIEAKEGIKVRQESKTLATITLQNYFRMYQKLAGMTGTAKTEESEFREIYNMDVVVIPTNKPVARVDMEDSFYATERGKYKAIVDRIAEYHATGQPVLVGTISIEKSELISEMLKKRGVKHNVLNAKQHQREAEIVAEAGRLGAVTIATNMAGRGTDIILGGNPEFEAKKEMRKNGYSDEAISFASSFVTTDDPELLEARATYQRLLAQFKEERAEEQAKVRALGGLCIIGTERHESRRIDNQLRGRAGRQGDQGRTQFFLSMEDELMRLFGGERMQGIVSRMGVAEDEPIEAGMLTKSIEGAQKKVEGRNFGIRKYVLQYDNVMNKQREIIYGERRRVLDGEDLRQYIMNMAETLAGEHIDYCVNSSKFAEEWNIDELNTHLQRLCASLKPLRYTEEQKTELTEAQLREDVMAAFERVYAQKEKEVGAERMRDLERMVLLRVVDNHWMDHIDAMDQLKTGINLRAIGQQDPAAAYANEGFDMFDLMTKSIQEDTVRFCFNVTVQTDSRRRQVIAMGTDVKRDATGAGMSAGSEAAQAAGQTAPAGRPAMQAGPAMPQATNIPPREGKPMPVKKEATVGRNDLCPCGSGKKYKKCCGKNAE